MTRDPNDPELLVSSADDAELRALLEAGRDELPSKAQLDGLASKLGPILGPGGSGGHGGAGGAAAKVGAGGAMAKVLGALTLAVVVGGGAVQTWRSGTKNATSNSTPMVQSTNAVVAAAPVEAPPAEETPPPAPSPAVVAAPAPRRLPSPAPSVIAPVDDSEADVTLVQSAHAALASDPARTLALCAEHARRFPNGLMAQEREVLAIEALVKTGRMSDARARADRFAASYPSSTHLRRIHAVLGD
jgi:hypothetical protein